MILPRGSGKTTILLFATLWVALHGHRRFPFLSPGDGAQAPELLNDLTNDMLTNDMLFEDFPEVIYPVWQTEGIAIKARYQISREEPTFLRLGKYIRFPSMPENIERGNAGVFIKSKGFLGSVRGSRISLNGETYRPDFYLVDDPQTRESASSPKQIKAREKIIKADLLRGVGPTKKPAVFAMATVIEPDDLAHRMCDPSKFPGWDSLRVQFLTKWPKNMSLWETYAQLRLAALYNKEEPFAADRFYLDNQAEMDEGAEVYWPERIDPGSVSAIQTAMNRWVDDPDTFASEDQNDPVDTLDDYEKSLLITEEDVLDMITSRERGIVPDDTVHIVPFCDVSQDILWWMVAACNDAFDVTIIEYGTHPDNGITARADNVKVKLKSVYGKSTSDSIYQGVDDMIRVLSNMSWQTESGDTMSITGGLVDSKWGTHTKGIRDTVWDSKSVFLPSEGIGIRVSARELNNVTKAPEPREIRGHHWRQIPMKRGLRLIYDVNSWKSFTAGRIKDRKVKVFSGTPGTHRLIIEQLQSEYPKRLESKERVGDEWYLKPRVYDNHLWDCLVGIMVRLSHLGVSLPGLEKTPKQKSRRRVRYTDYHS